MADMHFTMWMFVRVLLLFSCVTFVVTSERYGREANTIHVARERSKFQYNERTIVINAEFESGSSADSEFRRRFARSVTDPPTKGVSKMATYCQLNDSHNQMIVHWAGEGSAVILALSKESRPFNESMGNSNLFISYDYGKTFINKEDQLRRISGVKPVIDHYYNSKVHNSHYIFTDLVNKYIYTTTDFGGTFLPHRVTFRPKTVAMHRTNPNVVLAMDDKDEQKVLYISEDFGQTWRNIQSGVKSFYLGSPDYDGVNDIFVERTDSNGKNIVVRSKDFFNNNIETLIDEVEDFEIRGAYMFATKKVRLLGGTGSTLQLWVSYKRAPFRNARFSVNTPQKDYYVADASEEEVFLCVNHNDNSTHLYISDLEGLKFSLSLRNVVYYNPKGANKDTWLRYFADEAFADIAKIEGVRGVYIASQLFGKRLTQESQRTLITFDKGGQWELVEAPEFDSKDQPTNCSRANNCSLHLAQKFSRLYPGSRAVQVLSRSNAPGIVLATGTIGKNLKRNADMYLSVDAGYTWRMVLKGHNFYSIGDHGGIIVAVQQFGSTNEVWYSWDEGEMWEKVIFHKEKIRVYGLLTEPGEKTAVFSLFGSHLGRHRWLIVQINLTSIFRHDCTKQDYKMWSFPDNPPFAGCILGRKMMFQRRIPHAMCYNGLDYVREVVERNCSCRREDFECDFGFKLSSNPFQFNMHCIRDPDIHIDVHAVPRHCPPGTYYPSSRGYRRVAGDTCSGGLEHSYAPLMYSCPVREMPEFILYSTRNTIHRILLGSKTDEVLVGQMSWSAQHSIFAVDYDYAQNCVFWGDGFEHSIKRMCLDGNDTVQNIVTRSIRSVEALSFDWAGDNIYWIDSGNRTLEVARSDGRFRRTLFTRVQMEKPRALALDPHHGWMYWTDWSATRPRISKAWMDGDLKSLKVIVNGSSVVHWPNGITIDHKSERLYWTDAYLDQIMSSDLEGKHRQVIASGRNVPHPYSIGIYKDTLYWTDWTQQAIMQRNVDRIVSKFISNISNIMDLKVLTQQTQRLETACSKNNGACSQLCLPKPTNNSLGNNRTCRCGNNVKHSVQDGNEQCRCAQGEVLNNRTGDCIHASGSNCSATDFTCENGKCILASWICDMDDDCGDGSDETDCAMKACPEGSFKCQTVTRCIPNRWKCDFDDDCGDGSDENNCPRQNCTADQFQCSSGKCIPKNWTCDFDNDCHDGNLTIPSSDEKDCIYNETCTDTEFHCQKHQPKCVPLEKVCNGHRDCGDSSDEHNCTRCPVGEYRCANKHCIYHAWVCDGDNDCGDHSDEDQHANCSTTTTQVYPTTTHGHGGSTTRRICHFWQFQCTNGDCVWWSDHCDGVSDCGDGSDESNCHLRSTTASPVCAGFYFRCDNGRCVHTDLVCDGFNNCFDNSDELSCNTTTSSPATCAVNQFRCNSGNCIPNSWVCDEYPDCTDGEDEKGCTGVTCSPDSFRCISDEGCVAPSRRCNGVRDCPDGSDEWTVTCTTTLAVSSTPWPTRKPNINRCPNPHQNFHICQVTRLCVLRMHTCDGKRDCMDNSDETLGICQNKNVNGGFLKTTYINGTCIKLSWSNPRVPTKTRTFSYILSFLNTKSPDSYTNVTVGDDTVYLMKELRPLSNYTVRIYVNETVTGSKSVIFPLTLSQTYRTTEGLPTAPKQFKVHADPVDPSVMMLRWQPSGQENGRIDHYTIYFQSTSEKDVKSKRYSIMNPGSVITFRLYPVDLKQGLRYNVWVTASTRAGEGKASKTLTFTYDTGAISNKVTKLKASSGKYSVSLSWNKPVNETVTGYNISYLDAWEVENMVVTTGTTYTIQNLCPMMQYHFFIHAHNSHGDGPPNVILGAPTGTSNVASLWTPSDLNITSVDPTHFKITWKAPKASVDKAKYTVYYDTHPKDLLKENIAKDAQHLPETTKTMATLIGLQACDDYMVKIAMTSPAKCPLSTEFHLQTGSDDKGQPKELSFRLYSSTKTSGLLTWESPCYQQILPQSYTAYITDLKTKEVQAFGTPTITGNFASIPLKGLIRGASYNVTLRTNIPNSRKSEVLRINIPQYGAPENLHFIGMQNGKVQLEWMESTDGPDKALFTGYELQSRKGHLIKEGNKDHTSQSLYQKLLITKHTKAEVTLEANYEYWFRVRYNSVNGYPGNFSYEIPVSSTEMGQTPSSQPHTGNSPLSENNMIAILVSVAVIVSILVIVLAVFIVRHRRLQRSFLSFANSHYDTRSGTTTFSAANELGEDEDSPMIQGFSDDEPLVVA